MTMTRKETIPVLKSMAEELRDGGCTTENSPSLAAVESAHRIIETQTKSDRDSVACVLFRAGIAALVLAGLAFLCGIVTLFFAPWRGIAAAMMALGAAAVGVIFVERALEDE